MTPIAFAFEQGAIRVISVLALNNAQTANKRTAIRAIRAFSASTG